jgi:hypothetical protein
MRSESSELRYRSGRLRVRTIDAILIDQCTFTPGSSTMSARSDVSHTRQTARSNTSLAAQINSLVGRFVAGQSLADFHRSFMSFHEVFDARLLPDAQRDAYWAVYDLVRMSHPGLSEDALRERLQHFRLCEPHEDC